MSIIINCVLISLFHRQSIALITLLQWYVQMKWRDRFINEFYRLYLRNIGSGSTANMVCILHVVIHVQHCGHVVILFIVYIIVLILSFPLSSPLGSPADMTLEQQSFLLKVKVLLSADPVLVLGKPCRCSSCSALYPMIWTFVCYFGTFCLVCHICCALLQFKNC